MSKANWTVNNIPDQSGKVIIVTGATSGLGKEAARVLAGKNATVIMAVRNTEKGEVVAAEIRQQFSNATIEVIKLELSSLASVKAFATVFSSKHERLDVLINNAGVMWCPESKTEDGFEMQMGTNHFGHFALTGHLMPLLRQTKNSRVVATSSVAHKTGKIDLSDLNWGKRRYSRIQAYSDSKIANLHFAYEFARRNADDSDAPRMTSAHPGWTQSDLQRYTGLVRFLNPVFAQGPDMGVLPTLRAAFDPDAQAGDYFGPSGWLEMRGYPVKVKSIKRAQDQSIGHQFWELSERLTGISY